MKLIIASYRYRLIQLCKSHLRDNYITESDFEQITEMYKLYHGLGGNGQAQEYYDKNLLYFKSLIKAISDLLANGDCADDCDKYFDAGRDGKTVYVVISSDKGLAGGYNHNVLNHALNVIKENPNSIIVTYGRTAAEFFKSNGYQVASEYSSIGNPSLKDARDIAYDLCKQFDNGVINSAYVIYTDINESGVQKPVSFEVLPLDRAQFDQSSKFGATMIYDPSAEAVLNNLIPQYIIGLIYSILLHATVSEHKARMVAMESATRNADEMLDKLRLEYNRARQESITNELLEIVSGSLGGK